MKVWFDTEFIEDGKTIDLISIGMIKEDGKTLYMESADCDRSRASDWVKENVFPHMKGGGVSRLQIAKAVTLFVGNSPEFWAYYADYDWVVLCQLYGTMMEIPDSWPMYCRDLKQVMEGFKNQESPYSNSTEHNALSDAIWTKKTHEFFVL